MNACGSLMNGMNPCVPVILFQRVVIAVPGPAESLQPTADGKDAVFGRIGLGHRRQDLQQNTVFLFLIVLGHLLHVHVLAALQQQREGTFGACLLEKQHSFDIRVLYYGNRGFRGVLVPELSSLLSLLSIVESRIIGGRSHGCCPHPNAYSGLIHHLKHVKEAMVRLAHKISATILFVTQTELDCGASPVTQFMKNPGCDHVIGYQSPSFIKPFFRNNKERNALNARRGVFNPRQHEMNDIFQGIVIPGGDEYFLPSYLIVTAIGRFCRGGQIDHGASGFRFR